MPSLLLIMLGGALGALTRYGLGMWALERFGSGFPLGTLLINLTGSFVLGLLVSLRGELALSMELRLLLGTGFCGAYTTFSAFSIETLGLVEQGKLMLAAGYVLGSVGGGIGAAYLGFLTARSLG